MIDVKELVTKIDDIENKINERTFRIDTLINQLKSVGFKEEEGYIIYTKDNTIRKMIDIEIDNYKFSKLLKYRFIAFLICSNNVFIGHHKFKEEFYFEKYFPLNDDRNITDILISYIESVASKLFGI